MKRYISVLLLLIPYHVHAGPKLEDLLATKTTQSYVELVESSPRHYLPNSKHAQKYAQAVQGSFDHLIEMNPHLNQGLAVLQRWQKWHRTPFSAAQEVFLLNAKLALFPLVHNLDAYICLAETAGFSLDFTVQTLPRFMQHDLTPAELKRLASLARKAGEGLHAAVLVQRYEQRLAEIRERSLENAYERVGQKHDEFPAMRELDEGEKHKCLVCFEIVNQGYCCPTEGCDAVFHDEIELVLHIYHQLENGFSRTPVLCGNRLHSFSCTSEQWRKLQQALLAKLRELTTNVNMIFDCRNTVAEWVELWLREGNAVIPESKIAGRQDRKSIADDYIRLLKIYAQWDDFVFRVKLSGPYAAARAQELLRCPYEGCFGLFSQEQTKQRGQAMCSVCQKESCLVCRDKHPPYLNCAMLQVLRAAKTAQCEQAMQALVHDPASSIRPCPYCLASLQRDRFCCHVNCLACGSWVNTVYGRLRLHSSGSTGVGGDGVGEKRRYLVPGDAGYTKGAESAYPLQDGPVIRKRHDGSIDENYNPEENDGYLQIESAHA